MSERKAGRELDAEVAEKVMGLVRHVEERPYGYGPQDTEVVWRSKEGWKATKSTTARTSPPPGRL